jgi:hypothetical protein
LAFCLFACVSVGRAETIGANYYCREEFGGGLAYNEKTQKWQGAVFSTRSNFVVHMEEVRTTASGKYAIDARRLTVTKEGENTKAKCLDLTQDLDDMERVQVQKDIVRCVANITQYQFNIVNNRFLKIYTYGYVNGVDNGDDTPAVAGGRCTKIN